MEEDKRPKREPAAKKTAAPKKAAKAGQGVAPKKESAGAASSRKSSVKSVAKPAKKAAKKTPFWAPFAKKEAPKPAKEEERPSRGRGPKPRFQDEERPASRHGAKPRHNDPRPLAERPSNRPRTEESPQDRKRFSGEKKPMSRSVPPPKPVTAEEMEEPMRLNKYLSHCGIAARRQSAEYVKQGLVTVNGEVEPNPGYPVQPTDEVRFKGQVVKLEERKVYILMNKPRDIITTSSDEKGRKTVLDIIGKKVEERIFPVGRLDRMTSGLLLLTNDGDLAKKLSHPSHKVQKVYHVTLDKPFHRADFEKIQKGLTLEDGLALVDSLHYSGDSKNELEIEIHMGKNRIVRRIFEHLGYEVVKLDRTYYAGLTKKDIGRGHFRHLTDKEVIMLKHFK
jgi:23S rRNA pseudouridine2605 synthase